MTELQSNSECIVLKMERNQDKAQFSSLTGIRLCGSQSAGIFVRQLKYDEALDNRLKAGDQILKMNDRLLIGYTPAQAIRILKYNAQKHDQCVTVTVVHQPQKSAHQYDEATECANCSMDSDKISEKIIDEWYTLNECREDYLTSGFRRFSWHALSGLCAKSNDSNSVDHIGNKSRIKSLFFSRWIDKRTKLSSTFCQRRSISCSPFKTLLCNSRTECNDSLSEELYLINPNRTNADSDKQYEILEVRCKPFAKFRSLLQKYTTEHRRPNASEALPLIDFDQIGASDPISFTKITRL